MNRAALAPSALWSMTKEAVNAWSDDFAPSMGAAIAYYTAFSIAPLIVIVLAIAGFFFGHEAAGGYLYGQLAGLLGRDGAQAVQDMVASARDPGEGVLATALGAALLVLGATTVFAELQSDLDRIWKAPAAKRPEGVWGLLRSRVLSLGLVVSIGFVMLASLVISAGLAAMSSAWGGAFENFEWLLQVINFVIGFAVAAVLFALMYKILPRVSISWPDVWIGAFVTALLFSVGKLLVGLYIGKSSLASGFGAAGSLAVLLVWVYYSAQIFLLGAEFTWVYAHRYGSRQGKPMPASVKATLATTTQPAGTAPPLDTARVTGTARPAGTVPHRSPDDRVPVAAKVAASMSDRVRSTPPRAEDVARADRPAAPWVRVTAASAGTALVLGAALGGLFNHLQKK